MDDDESVCRALSRLVRSLGMDTKTFASGRDFLELLEALPSFRPDCVVLDIQMPGVNGLDVQDQTRQQRPSLPVIFITSYDELGVRERALSGGAVAYLRKPFNDAAFAEVLRVALERGE